MGRLKKESFEEFLDTLKLAGVDIVNEREVRERLGEVQRWREAFNTLARGCNRIGISFKRRNGQVNQEQLHHAFKAYQLPEQTEAMFVANLDAIL